MLIIRRGAVAAAAVAVASTWDPNNAGDTTMALSNGNYDVDNSSATWSAVRGTLGRSTGKYYFEILCINSANGNSRLFGFCDGSTSGNANLNVLPGFNLTKSAAIRNGDVDGTAGFTTHGGPLPSDPTVNDVIGIAVDIDNGNAWVALNNSWVSGDPVTATSPSWTWVGGTIVPLYPCFGLINSGKVRLVTSGTIYSPPSGYTVWG